MRFQYIIAVVAILVANGVGLLLSSSPAVKAENAALKSITMDVLQMHRTYPGMKKLPVLDVKTPI